jgi:hypothetical protein
MERLKKTADLQLGWLRQRSVFEWAARECTKRWKIRRCPIVGSYERENEASCTTEGWEFYDQPRENPFLICAVFLFWLVIWSLSKSAL